MAATYSILLTAFTNGFDFNQFQNDIINSTIESTNPLQGIELPPDYVVLTFSGDLTENDTAYIDTIVANFVPVTVYSYTITPQGPPSVIADADYTINAYDISTRIIQITPTVQRTITIPSDIIRKIGGAAAGLNINQSIQFGIGNTSVNTDIIVTLQADANRTNVLFGNPITISGRSSRIFRLRVTSLAYLTESFAIYSTSG